MSMMPESFKKPRPLRLPPYFYILLAVVLLAIPRPLLHLPTTIHVTTSETRENPEAEHGQSVEAVSASLTPVNMTENSSMGLSECGHIVLVSAARHGSTWLIDSSEGCTSVNGSYGRINRRAELWNEGQEGPLRRIEPGEAAEYALRNHSIKIFPPALTSEEGLLQRFFEEVRERELPVFVLRRRLEDSYNSLAVARETRTWNTDKVTVVDSGERKIVKDVKWELYFRRMEEYFRDVTEIMKMARVSWDEIRYEDAISQTRIVGQRSGCYIRNCNFRRR